MIARPRSTETKSSFHDAETDFFGRHDAAVSPFAPYSEQTELVGIAAFPHVQSEVPRCFGHGGNSHGLVQSAG